MTDLKEHPEKYVEIYRVFRQYELHHIVAELGMSHTPHAVDHLQEATASLNRSATRLAAGILAGSLLIGVGQVLSALIRTGAIGKSPPR